MRSCVMLLLLLLLLLVEASPVKAASMGGVMPDMSAICEDDV